RQALLNFQKKTGELQRAMMGAGAAAEEAAESIRYMKKALLETPQADPKLLERAKELEGRLQESLRTLYGDRTVRRRSEASLPGLMQRVSAQLTTTCPITETTKRNYEIAASNFEKLLADMRVLIDRDIQKLGDDLEAAGAPWTPGRRLPVWKKK
ncbi:MAG: glycosyl hydrolase, partial [Candidatus Aminicenantes bacterium]|nr:glycosyl hydrolase [Candidatus Aminicenantes bacterium]